MKWFMSYVQVYGNGKYQHGAVCYRSEEHPLSMARRWTERAQKNEQPHIRYQIIVVSFQQVPEDTPEYDDLSYTIPGG